MASAGHLARTIDGPADDAADNHGVGAPVRDAGIFATIRFP